MSNNITLTATRTPYAVTSSTTGTSSSTPVNTSSSTTPVSTTASTTPQQGVNVATSSNTATLSSSTTMAYGDNATNNVSKQVSSSTPSKSSSTTPNTSASATSSLTYSETPSAGSVSETMKNLIQMEVGNLSDYVDHLEAMEKKAEELNSMKDEEVFEGMTYEEIIQYRQEHAVSEVCKKIYENYSSCIIKFNNKNEDTVDFYNYILNYVYINKETDMLNSTGYGSTYFHEVGHLIDDFSDNFGSASNDSKYDFIGVLRSDFETYVSNLQAEKKCSVEEAYKMIEEYLWQDEDMTSAISDIIIALTDKAISGKYGHGSIPDKEIEREAFADFFDAGMSYKPQKLMYVQEVFPNAYELFEKMLWEDIQNMNSIEKGIHDSIFHGPYIIV